MLFAVESPLWVVTFCRQTNLNRCFFFESNMTSTIEEIIQSFYFAGSIYFLETLKNYSEIFICLCQYNSAFFQAGKVKLFLP